MPSGVCCRHSPWVCLWRRHPSVRKTPRTHPAALKRKLSFRFAPFRCRSFPSALSWLALQDGTVEVAPDGSQPRYTNTARSPCSTGADCMPHRASFGVFGEPNRSYRVSLPPQITAYGVRTDVSLTVVGLEARSAHAPSVAGGGRLDKAGRDSFFVGGTLQVPAQTPPDVFRAEVPVIVTYE